MDFEMIKHRYNPVLANKEPCIQENVLKTDYENVSTPKVGVYNVEFALKLRIYRSLKSFIRLK